jgi:peptide/nickel transport system substrate-binding protein
VREALELSIDRMALNQVVFDGEFEPGNQWVAPSNPYYIKEFPIPARDVAKAKALLAAAAVPNPAIEMNVINNPEALQAAQVVQAMAKDAGFDIRIKALELISATQASVKGDFQANMGGIWSGRTDPDGNVYNFWSCKAPPEMNARHYCNHDVDRELDAARAVIAPTERLAHYRNAAERILRDRSVIYLYHPKWLWAFTNKLTGFAPLPDGLIRPQGLRLE